MAVYIRPRRIPRQAIVSEIEEIGSQFEAVPPHQLRAQAIMEWGMPVRIRYKSGVNPYAGKRNELTPRQQERRKRLMRHVKK